VANGAGKDLEQVFDAYSRRTHSVFVVKTAMDTTRVNMAPLVAQQIRVDTVDVESVGSVPVERSHRIVLSFKVHIDSFPAQLGSMKTIEQNGPSSSLSVPNLTRKNNRAR